MNDFGKIEKRSNSVGFPLLVALKVGNQATTEKSLQPLSLIITRLKIYGFKAIAEEIVSIHTG